MGELDTAYDPEFGSVKNITRRKIIAFAGPKGSGKDTAAARLLTRNEIERAEFFVRTPFAYGVKEICKMVFGLTNDEVEDSTLKETKLDRWPFETPRKLLQDIANHFRDEYSPDVWVKTWERRIQNIGNACALITDMRFPEEVQRVKDMGGYIVYVQRDSAEEKLNQAIAEGDPLATNVSESHWDFIKESADEILYNNGMVQDIFDPVEAIVKKLYGHWLLWPLIKRY